MNAPFCTYELKKVATKTRKIPNKKSPMTPEQAEKTRLQGDNIGILLNQLDFPLTCLDIDNAYDNVTDTLKGSASYIVGICEPMGAIIERSQSGNGLHIFLAGNKPNNAKTRVKLSDGAVLECYDSNSKQFIALSFAIINQPFKNIPHLYKLLTTIPNSQKAINQIAYEYLSKKTASKDKKVIDSHNLNDDEVIKIASNSKHKGQFKSLHFDGVKTEFNSDSEADYAYFKQLAFFTACNPLQMERIALSSALKRSKWSDKHYLQNTIRICIEKTTKTYSPNHSKSNNVVHFKSDLGISSKAEIDTLINKCSPQLLPLLPYSISTFLAKSRPLPILQQQAAEYAAKIAKKRGYNCEKELIDTSLALYKNKLKNMYSFLDLGVNTTEADKKYLEASDAKLKGNDTLLVRSHMGTGKTYAVMKGNIDKLLSEKQHAKILVLSSRQQLCQNIAKDTGLNYYQDVKKMKTAQEKKQASCRIVACVNSIGMLNLSFNYDLIIIDESELTFIHLLGGTIAANERKRTLNDLYSLLNQANNVICLDAFISRVTHDAMCDAGRKNIRLLNNSYNPWSKVNIDWYTDKTKLTEATNNIIKTGENVFIFCNTKTGAKQKEDYYKRNFTNKKILCIHADNIKEDVQQACTHNTALLKEYDIVIASPTIEAGFSIELEEFKNVVGFFVHTKEGTGAALSSLQQLGRARKASKWHIWTDIKHYTYTTDPNQLLAEYVSSNSFTVKRIEGKKVQATFTPDNLTNLNISVKSWENTQREALALTLYAFISDYMNISVDFIDHKGSKETKEQLRTSAELVHEKSVYDLVNAETIDDQQQQELFNKQRIEGLTYNERLSLDKHNMLSMLPYNELNNCDLTPYAEMYTNKGMNKIRKLEQLTCSKKDAKKYIELRHKGGLKIDDESVHDIEALHSTELAKNNLLIFRELLGYTFQAAGYDVSRLTQYSYEEQQLKNIKFSSQQIMQSNWHKFMLENWQAVNSLGLCSHIKDVKSLHKKDTVTKVFISIFNNLGFKTPSTQKRVTRDDFPIYIENKTRVTEAPVSNLHGGVNKGGEGRAVRVRFYSLDVDSWMETNATLWEVLHARFSAGVNWVSEYCEDKGSHIEYNKNGVTQDIKEDWKYGFYSLTDAVFRDEDDFIHSLPKKQKHRLIAATCRACHDYKSAKLKLEDIFKGFKLSEEKYSEYQAQCITLFPDTDFTGYDIPQGGLKLG